MEGERFPFRIEAMPGVFWFTVAMWLLLLGGGVSGAYALGVRGAALSGFALAAVALLAVVAAYTRRDAKVLYDDAIEFISLFGITRFSIADLEGYRKRKLPNFPFAVAYHLVPRDRAVRGRAIVTIPGASPAIDAWLAKLQDVEDVCY